MFKPYIFIVVLLVLSPVTQSQVTSRRPVRIFIENHVTKGVGAIRTTSLTDPLREKLSKYGISITIVDNSNEAYDVRLILTTGRGAMWCASTMTQHNFNEAFFSVSAVALDSGGKTLFTAAQAAKFGPEAAKLAGLDVAESIHEKYQELIK